MSMSPGPSGGCEPSEPQRSDQTSSERLDASPAVRPALAVLKDDGELPIAGPRLCGLKRRVTRKIIFLLLAIGESLRAELNLACSLG